MSIAALSLRSFNASLAYNRAALFDKMKNGGSSDASGAAAKPEVNAEEISGADTAASSPAAPPPNTIPFRPGFAYEYGQGTQDGTVKIAIQSKDKVSVELSDSASSDDRRKAIRSLVMLGLGKISRDELNKSVAEGKSNMPALTREIKRMGLKETIPFGLGDSSYYINENNQFSSYEPVDIKA